MDKKQMIESLEEWSELTDIYTTYEEMGIDFTDKALLQKQSFDLTLKLLQLNPRTIENLVSLINRGKRILSNKMVMPSELEEIRLVIKEFDDILKFLEWVNEC